MNDEFAAAVRQICDEKGIKPEQVYETIEAAIASAYRKDCGTPGQKIEVKFNQENGTMKIFRVFDVVKEVEDPDRELTTKEAKEYKKKPKIGDVIKIQEESPETYGRIAAQTAKQVVVQKIRESEREVLFNEFRDKAGELLTGVVQQVEGRNIIINLGKTNGILFPNEQIPNENYFIGQRIKIYVVSVEETTKNPQILLSRVHPGMIERLFELEVPEINSGAVEIKSVAREAGKRSKVAVISNQDGVDPVGSCVGQRGTRIQTILAEIGEEKIDIILWDENTEKFIENALSPAKIKSIKLDKKNKIAVVKVDEDQLSLAIGKEGQNVRLASKLTGWEIKVEKAEEKKVVVKKIKKEKDIKEKKSSKKSSKEKVVDKKEELKK
jgi:N utilization substance protein A